MGAGKTRESEDLEHEKRRGTDKDAFQLWERGLKSKGERTGLIPLQQSYSTGGKAGVWKLRN